MPLPPPQSDWSGEVVVVPRWPTSRQIWPQLPTYTSLTVLCDQHLNKCNQESVQDDLFSKLKADIGPVYLPCIFKSIISRIFKGQNRKVYYRWKAETLGPRLLFKEVLRGVAPFSTTDANYTVDFHRFMRISFERLGQVPVFANYTGPLTPMIL